jgi:hypothetical protein
MKLKDVINHFGSKLSACEALGVTRQSASKWGYWMPRHVSPKIEAITNGALEFKYFDEDIVVDGIKYKPATDFDQALKSNGELKFFGHSVAGGVYRTRIPFEEIYFLVDGEMIHSTTMTEQEKIKAFRNRAPYRRG